MLSKRLLVALMPDARLTRPPAGISCHPLLLYHTAIVSHERKEMLRTRSSSVDVHRSVTIPSIHGLLNLQLFENRLS